MASKPARVTVSASTLGIARRTSAASLKRSSKSSCTIRQRTVLRLRSAGIGASVIVCSVWVLITLELFRHAKYNANHCAHRDRLAVLQKCLVTQMAHRLCRSRVENVGGFRVENLHARHPTIG